MSIHPPFNVAIVCVYAIRCGLTILVRFTLHSTLYFICHLQIRTFSITVKCRMQIIWIWTILQHQANVASFATVSYGRRTLLDSRRILPSANLFANTLRSRLIFLTGTASFSAMRSLVSSWHLLWRRSHPHFILRRCVPSRRHLLHRLLGMIFTTRRMNLSVVDVALLEIPTRRWVRQTTRCKPTGDAWVLGVEG